MRRTANQANAEADSETGFTLVEMMVTTALLMVVLAMVLPLIASSLNLFTNTSARSDAVDNAQLAFNQIERDVISSNVLYLDPATGIVHVQSSFNKTTSSCAEYQVVYPASPAVQVGTLERRTKTPGLTSAGVTTAYSGGWGNVMGGIVNSSQTGSPAVFTVPSASQYKSLVVNLWVQLDTNTGITAAAAQNYTSTFTGPAIPASTIAPTSLTSEPC